MRTPYWAVCKGVLAPTKVLASMVAACAADARWPIDVAAGEMGGWCLERGGQAQQRAGLRRLSRRAVFEILEIASVDSGAPG